MEKEIRFFNFVFMKDIGYYLITECVVLFNDCPGPLVEDLTLYPLAGYQRELTFQHKDGSFSAFGDRDKSGSMWWVSVNRRSLLNIY